MNWLRLCLMHGGVFTVNFVGRPSDQYTFLYVLYNQKLLLTKLTTKACFHSSIFVCVLRLGQNYSIYLQCQYNDKENDVSQKKASESKAYDKECNTQAFTTIIMFSLKTQWVYSAPNLKSLLQNCNSYGLADFERQNCEFWLISVFQNFGSLSFWHF